MGSLFLCHDDQPGRVLVQSVYDPGALNTAPAGQSSDTVEQRVHQRATRVTARRMDDHPGRFVDDQQPLVLVNHIYGDVLGDRGRRSGRRGLDDDHVADLRHVALFGDAVSEPNVTFCDESRYVRAGKGELFGEVGIKSLFGSLLYPDPKRYAVARTFNPAHSIRGRAPDPPPRARPGGVPRQW